MTEVLSIPSQSDVSSPFGSHTLRRSSSQSSFLLGNPTSCSRSSLHLNSAYTPSRYGIPFPSSLPSSAPSSPRVNQPNLFNQPLDLSTPSSCVSLDDQCEIEDDDDLVFPSYGDDEEDETYQQGLTSSEPLAGTLGKSGSSFPDISEPRQSAGDDASIKVEPSRHVDYLSHNWREEDIWSSWRLVVTKRKEFANSVRLENASWRTWAKSRARLRTVSPGTLNWMKDYDVTWLYGPLQPAHAKHIDANSTPPTCQLSRTNSFTTKKPCLKKRSVSELMLQRSLSSSTLVKRATDALRAQQPDSGIHERPLLGSRALSDFGTVHGSGALAQPPTAFASTSTSGLHSPGERRRIHFNDKVEQCIAINCGDDHDHFSAIEDDDDSSSDDGIIMMKPVQSSKARLSRQVTPRNSFSSESKTIAMLPSTTLKYRGDTPEPTEQEAKPRGFFWNTAATLASSMSQETLRPSRASSNFLLDDEDDEDLNWQPSTWGIGRKDDVRGRQPRSDEPIQDTNSDSDSKSLRRTPSGMFMPQEVEGNVVGTGLFGKVLDTVNTAKDIAHVIWNVGWSK